MSQPIEEIASACDVTKFYHVGSKSFLGKGDDDDYIFLSQSWQASFLELSNQGFEAGGSVPADEIDKEMMTSEFISMRRDDLNIILTDSEAFYKRFCAANDFVRIYHARHGIFTSKASRIELFQLALYGNPPPPEEIQDDGKNGALDEI